MSELTDRLAQDSTPVDNFVGFEGPEIPDALDTDTPTADAVGNVAKEDDLLATLTDASAQTIAPADVLSSNTHR